MTDQSINNLMDFLDVAKLKLNPLPTSYIADKADEYLKNLYATMLASVLVANGMISDNENRLFRLLLDSIGLEGETNSFISNVNHLTQNQALDFAKGLDTDDKRLNFIFEILMLARINSPLNDKQLNLINELCNVWSLKNEDLAELDFWIKKILGLEIDKSKPSNFLKVLRMSFPNAKYYKIDETFIGLNSFIQLNEKILKLKRMTSDEILEKFHKKGGKLLAVEKINEANTDTIISFATGLLWQIYKDEEELIWISILPLPSYLNSWTPHLKQIINF